MNDTTPTLAVLDHAAGPEADERPEDKRLKGERNRTAALVWLSRFGWLTSKMVSGLVWPAAAQGQTMARRARWRTARRSTCCQPGAPDC